MSRKQSEDLSSKVAGEPDDPELDSLLREVAHLPRGSHAPLVLPQAGRVVGGKYRIEAELGRGGMGAVYRATHTVSGKPVALKWMLRPASDERAKQRFTREARAAGRIDHPNVVDVYDIGEDGDAGYLVMELLHGESLRSLLARGPLAPAFAIDLLLPAMRGVSAAHRGGVIHRDLKPDNIFLCRGPDGSEREAKVLDFGISAIHAPEHESQATLTKDGTVLGTPAYMSPEQLASSKDVDALSDVYAFGVILYEVLTGALPFTGDSYSSLVLAIANTQPKAPRELRPELSAGLERVVLQAMDKDKHARPQGMDALIAALLPYAGRPSAGSNVDAFGATATSAESHPSLRSVGSGEQPGARARAPGRAALAVAALVGAAGAAWWWSARSSEPAEPSPVAREPSPVPPPVERPAALPPEVAPKTVTGAPAGADAVDGEKLGVTPSVPLADPTSKPAAKRPPRARPAPSLAPR